MSLAKDKTTRLPCSPPRHFPTSERSPLFLKVRINCEHYFFFFYLKAQRNSEHIEFLTSLSICSCIAADGIEMHLASITHSLANGYPSNSVTAVMCC